MPFGYACSIVVDPNDIDTSTGTGLDNLVPQTGDAQTYTVADYIRCIESGEILTLQKRTSLLAFLKSMAPKVAPAYTLVRHITKVGSGFPHIVELNGNGQERGELPCTDANASWQQYCTKNTVITLHLIDGAGNPATGSQLKEGGVAIKFTVINAHSGLTLTDADNPNKKNRKGLLAAKSGFEDALLVGNSVEFKCKILALSTQVGQRFQIRVATTDPAAEHALEYKTCPFMSRARSNTSEKANQVAKRDTSGVASSTVQPEAEAEAEDAEAAAAKRQRLRA